MKGTKKVVRMFGKILIVLLCFAIVAGIYYVICSQKYARMTYIGHASVKIVTTNGKVIYIDPYFPRPSAYNTGADYILVTHEHSDHSQVDLVNQNEGCKIIRWSDALVDGEYQIFEEDGIRIEAVPSGGNSNHDPKIDVGYIVTVDGVSVYHAGDTSMYDGLKQIAGKEIDYAMYPIDGTYNMDAKEAGDVADMIGATYNIPIHGYEKQYWEQRKEFDAKGKLLLNWGQTTFLKKNR